MNVNEKCNIFFNRILLFLILMNSKKDISNQKDNLIAIKVFINIEYDQNIINENITLNFRKNISVREMLKEIINNFNLHLKKIILK